MSAKGLADSTARTYISGIAYYLKLDNYKDVTQIFLVKKLLEGYKRESKSKDTCIRLPIAAISLENILKVLHSVCANNFEAKLFAAAYSLAFLDT